MANHLGGAKPGRGTTVGKGSMIKKVHQKADLELET
jgi:hypothetical protein